MKCNLIFLLTLYKDIGTRFIPNMKTFFLDILGIRTEKRQRINAVHCSRGIYLCLFDYKAMFVCVKDRTRLRMAIPACCFNIFGSIFDVLYYLLLTKLILWCKTIWQSLRKFLWAVWVHFLNGLNFLDNYFFIRPENFKN